MTKSFLRGQMKVHQAFWPEGFPGALNDTPFKLDIAKAKALLAEAGVKPGLTIKMDVISSPPFTEIAQSLQSTFAQAGITLELVPGTGSQVITKYRARNHEAVLLYWGPDFMDPHSNAGAFAYNVDNSDGSPQSTTTWRNSWLVPELSAETDAALKERDAAKRDALYVDLQRKVQASSRGDAQRRARLCQRRHHRPDLLPAGDEELKAACPCRHGEPRRGVAIQGHSHRPGSPRRFAPRDDGGGW
jgi:peptide/nickel transport system substrate-binding protein